MNSNDVSLFVETVYLRNHYLDQETEYYQISDLPLAVFPPLSFLSSSKIATSLTSNTLD